MLTRRSRAVVSPSLVLNEPAARMGRLSPSLGDTARPPENHFRPVSPSLEIPELMPSPVATPCVSPSLGLIPEEAMRRAAEAPFKQEERVNPRMTTAVCKRASRMARPSEPSETAQLAAERLISANEEALRLQGFEKLSMDETHAFRHTAPSTGKGPAVRADTGSVESDAVAQAMMNHVRATLSRRHPLLPTYTATVPTDGLNQEPPRRYQQPRATLADGRTQRVPPDVRPTGGQRDQKVRNT